MVDNAKGIKFAEDRFEILFKNIPIPTYTWQKIQNDLILIDYNIAAEDITKGMIKDFLGSKASQMYKDDLAILKDLNRCANEQTNFSREMKYNMKSTGEIKFFDVKFVFIHPDLILVHTEDITKRKRVEEEIKESEKNLKNLNQELEQRVEERTRKLKESEEKYRVLFENSPYSIGLVDMTGKIVDVNQIHDKIGNYNKSDFIGKNFNELLVIPQKYLPIIVKDFKRLLKGEIPKPKEIQLSDKEGNLNWFYLQSSLINLGNKSLIQVISQDITEIKESEKKLKESEEKYRSFVENFQGIAFRGHQDFSVAFFHGAVEEITGYKEEDFISGNVKWNELIHPDDLSNVQKAVEQFHSTSNKLDKREYRIISKDGKIHWIAENIQKIYDASRREEVVHGTVYDITEKKEAEQKLKESEEKYRLISENANDLITIINQEFKHEYINEQAYINILGYSNEDIIGKTPLEQIHPDDIKLVAKALRKGWKSGEGTEIMRLKHKNGHYCWLESKGKTFIDSDGKKKAILISRDITERMNAEEKLKESEEKFRTITEQSFMGIAILQDDVLKYANRQFADIFGYTVGEIMNWQPGEFLKIVHPEDKNIVIEQARKKQLGDPNVINQFQFRGIKNTGEIIWIELFSKTINYEGNTAAFATFLDITYKKESEQKLKESEEKFRNLVENISDAIIEVEVGGKFEYASPQIYDIFGYTHEEIIDLPSVKSIHPDDFVEFVKAFKKAIQSEEKRISTEYRTKHRDGHYITVSLRGRVYKEGKKFKLIGVIRDITENIKAEQKLKESEEKYRVLFENSPFGIGLVDMTGKIMDINIFHNIIGEYRRDELIGKNFKDLELIPKNSLPILLKMFKSLVNGEIAEPQEVQLYDKQGNTYWTYLHTSFLNLSDKTLIQVITQDISEIKEAQQRLKESEEKYRTLVEKSLQGICILQNIKIVFANNALAEILGYSIKELLSLSSEEIIDLIHPEDREFVLNRHKQRLEGKSVPSRYDFRIIRKDKKVRIVEMYATVIEYEGKTAVQEVFVDITEHKEAEQKLKESEERYRLITENANDLIATLDDKFKFEYINENAYLNILGLSNKDLIDKLCLSFVHPDDLKRVTKKLIKGFEVGMGEEELRFRNKAGEYIWVDVKGKTYLDQDGYKKAIVISRDITNRKNAQQRLKESEHNLKERVKELNCLYEISKLIEKEEISLDKIIQKTLKLIPEALQAPNLVCARIILDGKEYKTSNFKETEYKIATHIKVHEKLLDIEIYYLEDYQFLEEEIYFLYDIVIRLKNLLERKEAEKMVLESKERLKKFMDSATEGFILFDPQLNIIEINQALSLMMDMSKKELVGKNILEFMPGLEKSGISDKFLEVLKTERPFVIDDITSHPVRGDIHFSLSAFKVGTGLGMIITDITKHKQVEKKLKEINRLKTELLRRASHELKTPLVSIKGNADLMLDLYYDKMDSDIISFVEQIKEGCLRLEDLISDILESSKLESGQIQLKLEKEDLAFLINFCVNEVKGLADTRNQKISMEIHDKLITKFEKERIYEVIVNLLSNAIKYTPPEGIIKVKSEIKEDFYEISVYDNGIGFTEAEKEQIFKQFGKIERYGQGWDLGIEGTGLGLYISKKIIELHGGKIWVESEGRDKGSTFYFSLPIITD